MVVLLVFLLIEFRGFQDTIWRAIFFLARIFYRLTTEADFFTCFPIPFLEFIPSYKKAFAGAYFFVVLSIKFLLAYLTDHFVNL
jgi:hypothetical protein